MNGAQVRETRVGYIAIVVQIICGCLTSNGEIVERTVKSLAQCSTANSHVYIKSSYF